MNNSFDWFKKWGDYHPDKTAVKDAVSGRSLSYGEIDSAANALAFHLKQQHGIAMGDRVAIIAENHLAQVILFAVAQKTGIILVPINFRLAPKEIEGLLSDAQCKLTYIDDCIARESLDVDTVFEDLASIYGFVGEQVPVVAESTISESALTEDDPIFILYTSGTTGLPKGTLYTHKMLFWNSINTTQSLLINNDTVTLNCMPLFHTGGWNVLLTPVLHRGGTIIMFKKFDARTVLKCIVEEKLDLFMAVPTMLKMMVELPEFDTTDISCLNYIVVGGESMPLGLIETFHKKKVPIRQGYGLTEAGPNLTSLHQNDAERKQGSIGKPNFYVEVRILTDEGKDAPRDTPGEILIGGPMVMPGYWQNEETSQNAKWGRWLRTGDIGKIDPEGFIYILDRKKNMYISGGENVYPAEVERALLQHPAIKEAVVIAVPHDKWGECGVAFLVIKSGWIAESGSVDASNSIAESDSVDGSNLVIGSNLVDASNSVIESDLVAESDLVTEPDLAAAPELSRAASELSIQDLKSHCQIHLAKFKIPAEFHFLDSVPKGDTGKIDRNKIEQNFLKKS